MASECRFNAVCAPFAYALFPSMVSNILDEESETQIRQHGQVMWRQPSRPAPSRRCQGSTYARQLVRPAPRSALSDHRERQLLPDSTPLVPTLVHFTPLYAIYCLLWLLVLQDVRSFHGSVSELELGTGEEQGLDSYAGDTDTGRATNHCQSGLPAASRVHTMRMGR